MSFVPLIAQTTQEERLKQFGQIADSFVYCISLLGVTGNVAITILWPIANLSKQWLDSERNYFVFLIFNSIAYLANQVSYIYTI
jgi:hypothetical protein